MIHVCFPLHDLHGTYSKYEGVAICSLLENTKNKVMIHLLHDVTVSNNNLNKINNIVRKYGQRINFYKVSTDSFDDIQSVCGYATIGTLFRLLIPEILSKEIERIIYLDADILVNIDIKKLWEIELGEKLVAAYSYAEDDYWAVRSGIVSKEKFFNAGVMVLNLKKIREEHNLLQESIKFFNLYPQCDSADNDALNYIFLDQVKYLNSQYNTFTKFCRGNEKQLENVIYHFAGDFLNLEEPEVYDKEVIRYFLKSDFMTMEELLNVYQSIVQEKLNQMKCIQKLVKKLQHPHCKKIFFGARSVLMKEMERVLLLNYELDYCVDNNWLTISQDCQLRIFSPEAICMENKEEIVVFVLSKKYYREIKDQLVGYGLRENEDFFDARMLLTQNQGGYRWI